MNPQFIWQESDKLLPLVVALGADLHSPVLRLNQCWH